MTFKERLLSMVARFLDEPVRPSQDRPFVSKQLNDEKPLSSSDQPSKTTFDFYHHDPNIVRPIQPPDLLERWDLNSKLIHLGPSSFLTLRDVTFHLFNMGRTGGGKTSAVFYTLARVLLDWQCGFLINTVKNEDKAFWLHLIKVTQREKDLVIIGPENPNYFNFLQFETTQPGGKELRNLVTLFKTILSSASTSSGSGNGDLEKFWQNELDKLLTALFGLMILADIPITISHMTRLVLNAPPKSVWDAMRTAIYEDDNEKFYTLLDEHEFTKIFHRANANVEEGLQSLADGDIPTLSESQLEDWDAINEYWSEEYPELDDKTRSIIRAEFTGLSNNFRYGTPRDYFCNTKKPDTISPKDVLSGKIILLDFPTEMHHEVGRYTQMIMSIMCQREVLKRNMQHNNRPVVFACDEFPRHFNPKHDSETQATLRSKNGIRLVASQNLNQFYKAFPGAQGRAYADDFLGNCAIKIFCNNTDPVTNNWAARTFARDYEERFQLNWNDGGQREITQGSSISEELRQKVLPIRFTQLADGGLENNCIVEAVISNAGKLFRETGENYIKAKFRQCFALKDYKE